jgi:hypothetical protein
MSNYKQLLKDHICVVVFMKKNGATRVMRCTTKSDIIDKGNLTPVGGGAVVPDSQIRCIDVDLMQWRSFTTDSVINFQIEEITS